MRIRRRHVLGLCILASAATVAAMLDDQAEGGRGDNHPHGAWRLLDKPRSGERSAPWRQVGTPKIRLFAPDSVWNRPVPADTVLDPSSDRRVAALAELVESQIELPTLLGGGYPNISADEYSTPIYTVGPEVRRVPVHVAVARPRRAFSRVAAAGVPIPPGATPARGTDGHMTIYQRSSDTLWEFWRARKEADGWHAAWGGAMRRVSSNPGHYSASAWPGSSSRDGWTWGSTGTSLPVAAGTVTLQELARGRIGHALAAAMPGACRDVFSWPAQRSDGTSTRADCMPHGAHLRLDPALNLDALSLHPVARMLAEAAQTHGMIIRDSTRVSVAFFLESPSPDRPSPYTGAGGIYGGTPPWKVLSGFPWRSLQLLPLRLCTKGPCLPAR